MAPRLSGLPAKTLLRWAVGGGGCDRWQLGVVLEPRDLEIFTIGHSTLTIERFLELLDQWSVTAVADVRSAPFSRHFPHFSRDNLRPTLRSKEIAYVFLGKELGGRPNDVGLFVDGVADYEKMSETVEFANGLDRVIEGAKNYNVAMMCSEHNPLDCHRCLLVGRHLKNRNVIVRHILTSGEIVSHDDIELSLLDMAGKAADDLFQPVQSRLAAAYRDRAMKVAYSER